LVAGPLLGVLAGLRRWPSWQTAAAAVDDQYHLKDSTRTALAFLAGGAPSVFHELQIVEAVRSLNRVDPREGGPFRLPRSSASAPVARVAVAVALLAWPSPSQTGPAPSPPLPEVVEEVDQLNQRLTAVEKAAGEEGDAELQKAVREWQKQLEGLKQPGV